MRADEIADLVSRACPSDLYRGQKILLIIPDGTRTAPVGAFFKAIHGQLGPVTKALDILVALGTHPPMSEEAICRRLEITLAERQSNYAGVKFINHEWDNPSALRRVGIIPKEDVQQISRGLFAMDVPVDVNSRIFDYDQILLIGPVFPHEVVGFSGGNKYLFPGVAGSEILNFFHWLGAVVTNPRIIGYKRTPVRAVVDRAGSMVNLNKLSFCLVVDDGGLVGAFAGSPETAWDSAADLSREKHIIFKDHPFHTILSCAPEMYDDLWTGGKCMYKLEPVLEEGGELIIYAPHIREVSVTHGKILEQIGYHSRDYFLKQWDRFKDLPWGVLAHSSHVHGLGSYENGIEKPRARVTLATQLSPEQCRGINLGYRHPSSIRIEDYANREAEGILLVPHAGERLYRLKQSPAWACE